MCSGARRKKRAARRAAAEQARLNEIARQRQAELDAQAAAREVAVANQQAQMEILQQQQASAQAEQEAQVAALEQQRVAQEKRFKEESLATVAAGASLRVLAMGNKKQAPTAQVAGRKPRGQQSRYNSPTQGLRVGSSQRSAGSGVNLGA